MIMKTFLKCIPMAAMLFMAACSSCSKDNDGKEGGTNTTGQLPDGKELYRPEEFSGQDWHSDTCDYSYNRMAYTDNLVIYWQKGFGKDLANPPSLEGKSMKVDLENLKEKLETFYTYFRDELQFVKPGSLSEKYRMMVMIMYSLEGTAYGGTYDNKIGAFWAAPNRLQDEKLNAVAHELGHSFQLQIIADGQGEAWGGNGIYEMASQWMLWQVNPDWMKDENYHWVAFKEMTHKAFLHVENIYRSPYILEYWGVKHGLPVIAEMFRQGLKGEDPVITYKRMHDMTQEQFNDEMMDATMHLINLDYDRVYDLTRQWANSFAPFKSKLKADGNGWMQVVKEACPENYGFNAIKLAVPETNQTVTVDFKGLPDATGYNLINPDKAGWRYGLVGVTAEGKSVLGTVGRNAEGQITFTTPSDAKLSYLWLVVMGAPTEHWMNSSTEVDAQWPYKIKVSGTEVE